MTTITEKIERLGAAKLIGTYAPGTPEWHQARKGVGGSDIGTIAGKNPWASPYTLWAKKTGLVSDDIAPSMAMRMGTAFEAPIRDLYREEHPFQTVHDTGTWQSVSHPTWKANPDGIIEFHDGELGILEIKHSRSYWNDVPPAYALQVQWYLHVLGLKRGVIVSVAAGEYSEWEIDYDAEAMGYLEDDVRRFEQHVASNIAPEWDGSTATYELIRELSPGLSDGEIELGDLWEHLSNALDDYKRAEKLFNAFKSATLAQMEGIKYGVYNGERVITLQARAGKPFITFNH